MRFHLALFVSIALGGIAPQTVTHHIDGQWTVVAEKSPGYGTRPGVPALTLTVESTASETTVTLGRQATRYAIGKTTVDVKYGRRVSAFAEWQGERRFVVTGEREAVNGKSISYQFVFALNNEGELVMDTTETIDHAISTSKLVFRRDGQD